MPARSDSRAARKDATTKLAAPATRLVGRERELEALAEAVGSARLVTVVGAPGVGKSRLAIEVAIAEAKRLRGRVTRVDLVSASTRAAASAAVDDALDGATLVVLESFEHLAPLAAETVGAWLDAAPKARLLVTSRRPLRLAAERVFELGPLSPSNAAELFLERARAQGAALPDDAETPAIVGEIVAKLDGVPLAVELAAARTRALSLRALADELDRGIDVLSAGLSDAAPRHASLSRAIDASWSLLTPNAQRAAGRLSLFDGEFSQQEAAFLLESGGSNAGLEVLDLLGALTDASLISATRAADDRRFRLANGVRWFARARLAASADHEAARLGHAEHVAARARAYCAGGIETATPASALGDLFAAFTATLAAPARDRRSDDLFAVALCLDDALIRAGRGAERLACLDRAVEALAAQTTDDARPAILLLRRARVHRHGGRAADARADRRRAAEIAAAPREPRIRAALVAAAAGEALDDGQLETARALFEEAAAAHKALGDRVAEARDLLELGRVAFAEGTLGKARDHVERAVAITAALGDAALAAAALVEQAILAHEAGELEAARALFDRVLARDAPLDVAATAKACSALARVHLEEAKAGDARALLARAVALHLGDGDRKNAAIAEARLGLCDEIDGRIAEAANHYDDAIAGHADAQDLASEGIARLSLARVEAARGEAPRAHVSLDEGRRRIHASGSAPLLPLCDLVEASVELAAAGSWASADLEAFRDRARRTVAASTTGGAALGADARIARAILTRALGAASTQIAGAASTTAELVVSSSARWFRPPFGEAVSLSTSRSLRLILARLTEARESEPGNALAPEDLLAAGWPGERVLHDAGASRVYAAIAQLRRRGLRDVLLRRDDGYLLDPRVTLARADDADLPR